MISAIRLAVRVLDSFTTLQTWAAICFTLRWRISGDRSCPLKSVTNLSHVEVEVFCNDSPARWPLYVSGGKNLAATCRTTCQPVFFKCLLWHSCWVFWPWQLIRYCVRWYGRIDSVPIMITTLVKVHQSWIHAKPGCECASPPEANFFLVATRKEWKWTGETNIRQCSRIRDRALSPAEGKVQENEGRDWRKGQSGKKEADIVTAVTCNDIIDNR